jgi:hypothetical protein
MLRRCLLVICVLLIAAEAHAATLDRNFGLEITGGSIISSGSLRDTFFGFEGATFSAQGQILGSIYTGGPTFAVAVVNQGGIITPQVVVDGFAPCIPQSFQSCGSLQLTIAPLPSLNDDPAPFTATGQIFTGAGNCAMNIGQPLPPNCLTFDLVGQGFVTLRSSPFDPINPDASFVFSTPTPEPSTLVLLSIGILTLRLLRLLPNSKIQRGRILHPARPPACTSGLR